MRLGVLRLRRSNYKSSAERSEALVGTNNVPSVPTGVVRVSWGMFTSAKLRSAETYLSRHLTANDYYAEGEKVTGVWMGKGAELLGINGQSIGAKDEIFEALRKNRNPRTGQPLTQRTGEERVAFHDWQCSAPKSVSILAVTYGDERLRAAHEAAVVVAYAELERYAARRLRAGGKSDANVFTGNLVTAAFTHDASRALDAQLHTHLVCANATHDAADGKWYALQNGEMFRAAELTGRIYQNELARRVVALGYDIRLEYEKGKAKGFEIAGMTDEDLDKQSTRRKQIESEIEKFEAKHGRSPSVGERHVMATSTRDSKLAEITTEEVRAGQLARYSDADKERIAGLVTNARERANEPQGIGESKESALLGAAIESAVEHIAEHHAVFDGRAVLTRVLREHPGMVDLRTARDQLRERTKDLLVALDGKDVDARSPEDAKPMTTQTNLRLEHEAVEMVKVGQGRCEPLAMRYELNQNLTQDQRAAVEQTLGCRDQVMALRGPAGTGKTTTLSSLDQVVRGVAENTSSIYVAPTHQAKGVLQRDGFKEVTTVAQLLVDVRAKQTDLQGKLLVVDEAGMQSTKDGHALLTAATKAGARVLFVGDEKQIPAVEAGDFMGILRQHGKMQTAELSTIFRQRQNPEYLAAMEKMATGDVKGSLTMLDKQGRIHEAGGGYIEKAAKAYCEASNPTDKTNAASVALLAPTWREIDKLTQHIRLDRQKRGHLTGPEAKREVIEVHDHTKAERRSERTYRPGMMVAPAERTLAGMKKNEWCEVQSVQDGKLTLANGKRLDLRTAGPKLLLGERKQLPLQLGDRILLQGNDRARGLTNGTRGVVTGIESDGSVRFRQSVGGRLDANERTIPSDYKTLTHGYAMTVHSSQGETVSHVIGAVGRSISGNLWNVLASRGKQEVSIFVPDKKSTIERAPEKIENRKAALDFAPATPSKGEKKIPELTNTAPLPEAQRKKQPGLTIAAMHHVAAMVGLKLGNFHPGLIARFKQFQPQKQAKRELSA